MTALSPDCYYLICGRAPTHTPQCVPLIVALPTHPSLLTSRYFVSLSPHYSHLATMFSLSPRYSHLATMFSLSPRYSRLATLFPSRLSTIFLHRLDGIALHHRHMFIGRGVVDRLMKT